jgi:hypothetical protein
MPIGQLIHQVNQRARDDGVVSGVLVSPGAGADTLAHLVRVDPVEVTESGRDSDKVGGSRIGGRNACSCRGGVCHWLRPLPAFGPA